MGFNLGFKGLIIYCYSKLEEGEDITGTITT